MVGDEPRHPLPYRLLPTHPGRLRSEGVRPQSRSRFPCGRPRRRHGRRLEATPRAARQGPREVGHCLGRDRPRLHSGRWLLAHPGKVIDLFERLVAASGLPPIRLHDLRHGAATLMLADDIDSRSCRTRSGAVTPRSWDIYQSVLPHVGKNAAEATAKSFPSSARPGPRRRRVRPRRRRSQEDCGQAGQQ